MKINGSKIRYVDYFFIRRNEFFCPSCGQKMKVVKCSKVVNSRPPEAKDFDFHMVEGSLMGNIKFIWEELECTFCGHHITSKQAKLQVIARKNMKKQEEKQERKLKKESKNKHCIFKRNNSK